MLKKNKAFTLIEAIVVISILSIMAIAIIPSYRAYNQRNQLREAAQLVRSSLVEAQNIALAPKHTGGDWRYGARRTGDRTFVVYEQNGAQALLPLRTYNLPDPVQWATNNNWDVWFRPPNAVSSCNGSLSIRLRLINNPATFTVILNCQTGQINIRQP